MDELLKIIILAIVQGITEFLPISSSGHLVLMQHLLEIEGNGNEFEESFVAVNNRRLGKC